MSEKAEKLLKDLIKRVIRMESLIIQKSMTSETMTSDQAAAYLGIAPATLNKMSSPKNMVISCSKSGGKKKVFLKKDLDRYLETTKAQAA